MAEVPVSYFPDVRCAWSMQLVEQHATEILTSRNGREQRRGQYAAAGYRRWSASSDALNQSDRAAVVKFLRARRGRLDAFYFWSPAPALYTDVAVGTVAAQTRLIIPYKNSTITDTRVGGSTRGFTLNRLTPRSSTFAALRMVSASTQYVDAGASASLKNAGDIAIAAWVNLSTLGGNTAIAGNYTPNASGFRFWVSPSGELVLSTAFVASITEVSSTAPAVVVAGAWYHVAAVKASNVVTFYVNGTAVAGGGAVTNQVAATANFTIGQAGNAALLWDGMISDVRSYSQSLSAGNIASLFAGVDIPQTTLVGWWKLVDGTGTTTADASGTANTGTLTSGPVWVGGEDEVIFGAPQTGAVTATLTGRERLVCRSDMDAYAQSFIQDGAGARSIFQLAIKEVY